MNFPRSEATWFRMCPVDSSCTSIPVRLLEEPSAAILERWITRFIASKRTAFWAFDCWIFFCWMGEMGVEGVVVVDWRIDWRI